MRSIDLVVTKTPLRVSFLGGGTDIKYFYKHYGGSVLNCAIDKYVYVNVSTPFDDLIKLKYSEYEILVIFLASFTVSKTGKLKCF